MKARMTLITGGAGFIGSNLAWKLLERGEHVILFDDLSRSGVEKNVDWLRRAFGSRCDVRLGDVRDAAAVREALHVATSVFHLAGQPAVTSSLAAPVHDFEVNARGTLNVLEALRAHPVPFVHVSTNKVYGGLPDVMLRERGFRYEPVEPELRTRGVAETRPLDFLSPHSCSKGAADQYVHDYARSFGLDTVVLRTSSVYGPRQFGTADHGWVAHFLMRAMQLAPITIYGDGRQVRDVLYVSDLVEALVLARAKVQELRGMAFNVGGGPASTLSLLELLDLIAELQGSRPDFVLEPFRACDQRYYVSDTRLFRQMTGWTPAVGVREGLARLHDWLVEMQKRPSKRTLETSPP
jgi:CDP-paratose 2-epimerase